MATPGTLAYAISNANGDPGSTIDFTVTGTIALSVASDLLPEITAPTTIEGTSALGQSPVVEINGGGLSGDGLMLGTGSEGSTIEGLSIVNFAGAGILLESGTGSDLIEDDALGTGLNGTTSVSGNTQGVAIVGSASNTIGGTVVGAGNEISNNATGVSISGTSAADNVVAGNLIGTNSSNAASLGNGTGIILAGGAIGNLIGGTTAAAANIIASSTGAGVSITGSTTTGNLIAGNFIGTDSTGTVKLGNATGVIINIGTATTGNTIGGTVSGAGNVIAANTHDAVDVSTGSGNAIRENLIYGNGGGIFLAPSANNKQFPPSQLAVASVPNLTTIDFTLKGTVGQSYTVDFFATNGTESPAGVFLGTITTDPLTATTQGFTVVFPFSTPLLSTQSVTATATGPDGSTSSFATTAVKPVSPFVVTNTNDDQPGSEIGSLRQAILNANSDEAATGTDDITFAIPSADSPYKINLTSALPVITVPVTIDGTSQSGYSPKNLPIVELNGGGLSVDGFVLGTGSDGSTIGAFDIAGFHGAGIHIESTNDSVTGSFVGTDLSGKAAGPGNLEGILIDGATNSMIGGTSSAAANTIGFNTVAGVQIIGEGSDVTNDVIESNDIGTDPAGDNLANGDGIEVINASGNTIGGSATGVGNLIGQNLAAGVTVLSGNGNVVRDNLYSGLNGSLTSPSVAANDIILGSGANNGVAPPQFAAASLSSNDSTLTLAFSSTFSSATTLDVYVLGSNQRTFLASENVTAGNQPAPLTVTNLFPSDQVIATVTVIGSGTSTFSAPVSVSSATTVTNTNSSGPGSLAQAVSTDTSGAPIEFNIPGSSSTFVINLSSSLTIAAPLTIDGTSESAFLGRAATIALNGGNKSFGALVLGPNSTGSTIEGLEIEDFGGAAILVQSANNTIGGTSPGQGNIIVSNSGVGLSIAGVAATGNLVKGNFLGTNSAGATGLGDGVGILISGGASNNVIGGTTAAAANVIASSSSAGVSISGSATKSNLLEGNFIGTNGSGTKLGNGLGVVIDGASGNSVGGTATGAGNTIAFNHFDANHGAVTVNSAQGDPIRGNLIYGNTGTSIALSGIDLTNDGNDTLAAPVIEQVAAAGSGSTSVTFNVSSMAAGTYSLDIFASAPGDPIGANSIQAHILEQTFAVTIPATQPPPTLTETIPAALSGSQQITATWTYTGANASGLTTGDTSEFAVPVAPPQPFVVTNTNASGPGSLPYVISSIDNDTNPNPDVIAFQLTTTDPHYNVGKNTWTITLSSTGTLPAITHPVVLDGTSQKGYIGAPSDRDRRRRASGADLAARRAARLIG